MLGRASKQSAANQSACTQRAAEGRAPAARQLHCADAMAQIQNRQENFSRSLACVGHVGGTIDSNYRVRKEPASTPRPRAPPAAAAPGAAYRAARDAVSAALCDVGARLQNGSERCQTGHRGRGQQRPRRLRAARGRRGPRRLRLDFSFEGATRLRHLLSDATLTLEVSPATARHRRYGRSHARTAAASFTPAATGRSGPARRKSRTPRRLTAAAEKAVLRACCAWEEAPATSAATSSCARRAGPCPPRPAAARGARAGPGGAAVARALRARRERRAAALAGPATRGAHPVPGRRDARPARGGDAAPGRRGARGQEKALPAARRVAEIEAEPRRRTRTMRRPFVKRVDGVRMITTHRSRLPTSPSPAEERRTRTRRRPRAPGATAAAAGGAAY